MNETIWVLSEGVCVHEGGNSTQPFLTNFTDKPFHSEEDAPFTLSDH
jgi:hypothetical protein